MIKQFNLKILMQSADHLHYNLHQSLTRRRLKLHTHVELFLVSPVNLWKGYALDVPTWIDKNIVNTSTETIDCEFLTDRAINHVEKAKRTFKNLRVKTSPPNLEYKISGLSEKPCLEQTFFFFFFFFFYILFLHHRYIVSTWSNSHSETNKQRKVKMQK